MDWILWAICVAFLTWELFAKYVRHNTDAHTLSNRIGWLEKRYPKTRVLVAVACLVLGLHLTVGWL